MKRPGLTCSECGSSDFKIDIEFVPRGASITCEKCGVTTPLFYRDRRNEWYAINDQEAADKYEQSHYGDIE